MKLTSSPYIKGQLVELIIVVTKFLMSIKKASLDLRVCR